MYSIDNRSKKYKEEANDISNAKTQKYKQLHNKSNTLSPDITDSYQAFLDLSDNFMKLIAVVKFQSHCIIFLQKAKVFLPTSDASRLTLQHLIILL